MRPAHHELESEFITIISTSIISISIVVTIIIIIDMKLCLRHIWAAATV